MHDPLVQAFALLAAHAKQPAPPVPHWPVVGLVMQVEPEQQPLGQDAGLQPRQALLSQFWVPQFAHVAPPVPQAVFSSPVKHWLPEQHPLGHDEAVHLHAPPSQR